MASRMGDGVYYKEHGQSSVQKMVIYGGQIMFDLFNKNKSTNDDGFDPDKLKVHYEGGVMSPEYAVNSLNKENINDQDYPYHM